METICKLLDKHGVLWKKDENLDVPHILYEQMAADNDTVISHNFIVKYSDLIEKELICSNHDLEKSFYHFESKYFSKYFFREDTDLKWNYYLILIVETAESNNSEIYQLEQDDKYLRKLVMTKDEFEVYINPGKNMQVDSARMTNSVDVYAEWQRQLSEVGLDGILASSYESIKVQDYIEKDKPIRFHGRPTQNWENEGKENKKLLVKQIKSVSLDKFRSHCLEDKMKIPLTKVNLISGCNGAGKSSVCSAIEFALTGDISDVKKEDGKTEVEIKNYEDKCEKIKSEMLTKEKKALDQLWYGTVTMARKSSLNRNFHTFNYLGLDASGKFLQNIDINELVKNVLFGSDVTEAELRMERYGKAFADKRKEYTKQLNKISQEISDIQIDYDVKNVSRDDIINGFQQLGYKRKLGICNDEIDVFLSECRKILLEYKQYTEVLFLKCDKEESGKVILNKKDILEENRKAYWVLGEKRNKIWQNIKDLHKKIEKYQLEIKKIYEGISNVEMLLKNGKEMENIFFSKQDFFAQKSEYENNTKIKGELLDWINNYQECIYFEGNESELDMKIHDKEIKVAELNKKMNDICEKIELQKKQNDNLDTIFQEIISLAEEYCGLDKNAKTCPVCGTDFKSGDRLLNAVNKQKEFRIVDESFLQSLLKLQSETKKQLDIESASVNILKKEKENAMRKKTAILKLKEIIPLNMKKSGEEIQKDVAATLDKLQAYLESNLKIYRYVQKVLETNQFIDYSEGIDWMLYLKGVSQNLEKQKTETETLLKNQEEKEHELKQEYERVMEENIIFSEQEWQDYILKANGFQVLERAWEISEDIPVFSWIEKYNTFLQEVQYAEDAYNKQEVIKFKKAQINKLEEKKRILEKQMKKCKRACEVIENQKHLEDVMNEFLNQNAKQIELFFKLLHRPKEFGKLSIENGNIYFVRNKSGKFVESKQMSTGQRMALAFSVMITLHITAANAPGFLMLDEPVANLDDMHVLNLIDLLRQLAISGTQIIITTADSQMAKFLRRKFSFLQDEYSHLELTRKGDEHTKINVIHYSPNKKAMTHIQSL